MSMLLEGDLAFSGSGPPPPPPPGAIPDHITGTVDRQTALPSTHRTHLGGYVYKVNWVDLQPLSPNDWDTSAFAGLVTAIGQLPTTKFKIRAYAGIHSPPWVRNTTGVGTLHFEDPDPANGGFYDCPRWWRTAAYGPLYRQFMEKLRDYFVDQPLCIEIQNSMCSTVFAEPMQRQMGSDYTVNVYAEEHERALAELGSVADGGIPWTHQRDIDAHLYAVDLHADVFKDKSRWASPLSLTSLDKIKTVGDSPTGAPIRSSSLVSPYDGRGVAKSVNDLAATYQIADRHVQQFGKAGVLMNNGFSTQPGPDEVGIYEYMTGRWQAGETAMAFQTETEGKLTAEGVPYVEVFGNTVSSTTFGAAERGAMYVEMPSGYQNFLTTAQLDTLNTLLALNEPV